MQNQNRVQARVVEDFADDIRDLVVTHPLLANTPNLFLMFSRL